MKMERFKGSVDPPEFLDPVFPLPRIADLDLETTTIVEEEARLFRHAAIFLYLLSLTKAQQYGNSWCKRGMSGIFYTLARKWDRLEQAFKDGSPIFAVPGEHIEETIKDAAVYFVKWVGYIRQHHPDIWANMVADVQCELNVLSEKGVLDFDLPLLEKDEEDRGRVA